MSTTLNSALDRLREFAEGKLAELEARAEEHRDWLKGAVGELGGRIAALAPAVKKQRLDGKAAKATTMAEEEEPVERARMRKGGAKAAVAAAAPPLEQPAPDPPAAPLEGAETQQEATGAEHPATASGRRTRRGRQKPVAVAAEPPEPVGQVAQEAQLHEPAPRATRRGRKKLSQETEPAAAAADEAEPAAAGEQPAQPPPRMRRGRKQQLGEPSQQDAELEALKPADALEPLAAADTRQSSGSGKQQQQHDSKAAVSADPPVTDRPARATRRTRGQAVADKAASEEPSTSAQESGAQVAATTGRVTRGRPGAKPAMAEVPEQRPREASEEPVQQAAPPQEEERPPQAAKGRGRKAAAGGRKRKPEAPELLPQPSDSLQTSSRRGGKARTTAVAEEAEPASVSKTEADPAAVAAADIEAPASKERKPSIADESNTSAGAADDEHAERPASEPVLPDAEPSPAAVRDQAAADEHMGDAAQQLPAAITTLAAAQQQTDSLPLEPADGGSDAPASCEPEAAREVAILQQRDRPDATSAGLDDACCAPDRSGKDADGDDAAAAPPAEAEPAAEVEDEPADAGSSREVAMAQQQQRQVARLSIEQDAAPVQSAAAEEEEAVAAGAAGSSEPQADAEPAAAPSGGITANLVASIRSFLPMSKPAQPPPAAGNKKPPQKLKALEAAEAARRKEEERMAERQRQKAELDRQRLERAKAKQEEEVQRAADEARRKEEARVKREQEAERRRKEQQEAERREREEKQRRLQEARRRKEEAAAAAPTVPKQLARPAGAPSAAAPAPAAAPSAPSVAVENRPLKGDVTATATLAEAKQRLQRIQEAAIQQAAQQGSAPAAASGHSVSSKPAPELKPLAMGEAKPGAVPGGPSHAGGPPKFGVPTALAALGAASASVAREGSREPSGPQTYEISPYKSDHDSDDDQPRKPVPDWARGSQLRAQLVAQAYVDPDEIFQQHHKTCSLDEVFANGKSKQDLSRRTSSGNWIEDRVTWKEEMAYKRAMGFL